MTKVGITLNETSEKLSTEIAFNSLIIVGVSLRVGLSLLEQKVGRLTGERPGRGGNTLTS